MENCWSYALRRLLTKEGWLIAKLTNRSSAKPSSMFQWFGYVCFAMGVALINYGMLLITGRWLHVYYAEDIKGPYSSYEPVRGPTLKKPPVNFKGKVITKDNIKLGK